jgi:hypothetical protein
MFKWDRISWFATTIFVAGCVLAAVTGKDGFLLMIAASFLLRPTINALGFAAKYSDERQTLIQYRSGNLALTILSVAIIIFIIKNSLEGKPADDLNILLAIGLVARPVTALLLNGSYRQTALRVGVTISAAWLLFVVFENGLSVQTLLEGSPGILILAVTLLGLKKPRISSVILIIMSVALFYMVAFRAAPGFTFYQVIVALMITVPLATEAIAFYRIPADPVENTPEDRTNLHERTAP